MARLRPKFGDVFHRWSAVGRAWWKSAVVHVAVAIISVSIPFSLTCNIDTRQPSQTFGEGAHSQPGSYFGYTVLQHFSTAFGWRVLVGAPRAPGSSEYGQGFEKPGALWACDLATNPSMCSKVTLRNPRGVTAASLNAKGIVDDLANGWMGVSLARQSNDVVGDVTVCGHRVGNDFAIRQPGANLSYETVDQYIQGLCYTLDPDFLEPVTRFNPCAERDEWRDGVLGNNSMRWQGWCQFGMSATYTVETDADTAQSLVVGAVGAFNWTGTTYTQDLIGSAERTTDMVAGNLSDWNPGYSYNDFYQYIGYSSSVGKFLSPSTQQGAVGAPRAAGLIGRVYIYDLKNFDVYQELQGELMNTYFGSAVEAVDINNDGLSDLLVGAPLYSTDQDEGRVYVYMNRGGGTLLELHQTIDGTSTPGARFGYVITTMGDLNKDAYPDVAIGAPYEGGGVVYIYQSTENGIDEAYSQRIVGRDTDPTVETFGSSIAKGEDFDSNAYPDLVVGAYASDMVFLYKTQPLLDLEVELTVSPDPMDPENPSCVVNDQTCLEIQVCYNYNGPVPGSLPADIEVIYDIEVDNVKTNEGLKPRFLIDRSGETNMKINTTETIYRAKQTCFNYTALLQEAASDFLSPMPVQLTYVLMEYPVEGPARDDSSIRFPGGLAPVMKSYQCSAVTTVEEVNFVRDCGENAVCETDLQLDASIEIDEGSGGIIVGGTTKLYINNLVKNVGEEAHQATLTIDHPLDVRYEGIEINRASCINADGSPATDCDALQTAVTCEPMNLETMARVTCDLGNPMKSYTARELRLRFDVGGLIWDGDRSISISVVANTSSMELRANQANNRYDATYNLLIEADVGIYGSATPESVYYSSNSSEYADEVTALASLDKAVNMALTDPASPDFNDTYIGTPFMLSYRVTNDGPGRLPFQSLLTINIPWRMIDGDWLLYIKSIQVISSTGTVSDCNVDDILRLQADRIFDVYVAKSTNLSPEPAEEISRIFRGIEAAEDLGCGKAKCVALRCHIDAMQVRSILEVRIAAVQWQATLIMRKLGYVQLLTEANVIAQGSNGEHGQGENANPDQIQLLVKYFTDVEGAGKVPIWVIIVSIIGGILLLILLILLMWKCGFFKRKTREDWEKEAEGEGMAGPTPVKPPMDPHGELDGSDLPMMKGLAAE